MARSTVYIDSNKKLEEVKPQIVDYLTSNGFKRIEYYDEPDVYQKGKGLMSAAIFIALKEEADRIQLDAWIKNGFGKSESGLNTPIGILPKKNLKKHLNEIEELIQNY